MGSAVKAYVLPVVVLGLIVGFLSVLILSGAFDGFVDERPAKVPTTTTSTVEIVL